MKVLVLFGLISAMNYNVLASSVQESFSVSDSYNDVQDYSTKSNVSEISKKSMFSNINKQSAVQQIFKPLVAFVVVVSVAFFVARCVRALNTKTSLRRLATADGGEECGGEGNGDGEDEAGKLSEAMAELTISEEDKLEAIESIFGSIDDLILSDRETLLPLLEKMKFDEKPLAKKLKECLKEAKKSFKDDQKDAKKNKEAPEQPDLTEGSTAFARYMHGFETFDGRDFRVILEILKSQQKNLEIEAQEFEDAMQKAEKYIQKDAERQKEEAEAEKMTMEAEEDE